MMEIYGHKILGILMEFLHLGAVTTIFSHFYLQKDVSAQIFLPKPTLSPKDPNFPAWWEKHKSEWEEPKKEGQEPADD